MTMHESELKVQGVVTFWTVGEWTRQAALAAGLRAAGLGQFAPEPRTSAAAFKDALAATFAGSGWEVHRLKELDAYEIIRVERGQWPQPNLRALHCVGRIEEGGVIRFSPVPPEAAAVLESFNKHLGLLRAAQVGAALVEVLGELGGTRLRPSGSVYWLPEHRLGDWQQAAAAVEAAGASKPNAVYLVRHAMDADAVRAVRDAVIEEVSGEAARIQREIDDLDNPLGDRALQHRKDQALELRRKVLEYEGLLGVGLERLREQLEAVETAAAQAALMAAAQAEVA